MVRRLKELQEAVLELGLLGGANIRGGVAALESLLAAHSHHRVHELGIRFHSEFLLVHVCSLCGINKIIILQDLFLKF